MAVPEFETQAYGDGDDSEVNKLLLLARCELAVKGPGGNPRAAKLLERIRAERSRAVGPAQSAASPSP